MSDNLSKSLQADLLLLNAPNKQSKLHDPITMHLDISQIDDHVGVLIGGKQRAISGATLHHPERLRGNSNRDSPCSSSVSSHKRGAAAWEELPKDEGLDEEGDLMNLSLSSLQGGFGAPMMVEPADVHISLPIERTIAVGKAGMIQKEDPNNDR
jgi:hypothetical protein